MPVGPQALRSERAQEVRKKAETFINKIDYQLRQDWQPGKTFTYVFKGCGIPLNVLDYISEIYKAAGWSVSWTRSIEPVRLEREVYNEECDTISLTEIVSPLKFVTAMECGCFNEEAHKTNPGCRQGNFH
jgi:hypothetical protein